MNPLARSIFGLLLSGFFIQPEVYAQNQEIPLWSGLAPGSESWTQQEIRYLNDQKQQMVRNVVNPALTVYLPDKARATGTAVIIAPGGGFRFLSWQTEGTEVAEWLVNNGVAAFVLKYRTMNTGTTPEEFRQAMIALFRDIAAASNPDNAGKPEGKIESRKEVADACVLGQEDGRQAIRLVREHAAGWNLNPNKIGIVGFSAGGMVALGTLLQQNQESRPDFAGIIYTPWSDAVVPHDAPPVFIVVAGDDQLTAPGCVRMYSAWKAAGIDAELHVYSKGGHGFGMQKRGLPSDGWIEEFGEWMELTMNNEQ